MHVLEFAQQPIQSTPGLEEENGRFHALKYNIQITPSSETSMEKMGEKIIVMTKMTYFSRVYLKLFNFSIRSFKMHTPHIKANTWNCMENRFDAPV